MELKVIARIRTDFGEKFGIPRQSGLVPELTGRIVFEPAFKDPAAVKDLVQYDRIWLIWGFSELGEDRPFSPTVRPPRLGGNKRVSVFATRSPFRPNPIGLSCVSLLKVETDTAEGPVLTVGGADLMDGTPIYDIKPYLPHFEAFPEARGGFSKEHQGDVLRVDFPEHLLALVPEDKRAPLKEVLALDPRPAYQHEAGRIYGLNFAGLNIRFQVTEEHLIVTDVSENG